MKTLLWGVFVVAAFLALTAAIIAIAPYIAALVILGGLVWLLCPQDAKHLESTDGQSPRE